MQISQNKKWGGWNHWLERSNVNFQKSVTLVTSRLESPLFYPGHISRFILHINELVSDKLSIIK